MPAIWMRKQRNEFGDRRTAEPRDGTGGKAVRGKPPDPTAIIAAGEIEPRLNLLRQAPRMLDHFPVHIDDVERAVRRVRETDRAKPSVTRGDEFALTLVVRSLSDQADAIRPQAFAMD